MQRRMYCNISVGTTFNRQKIEKNITVIYELKFLYEKIQLKKVQLKKIKITQKCFQTKFIDEIHIHFTWFMENVL